MEGGYSYPIQLQQLVKSLVESGVNKSKKVKKAMLDVDRADFCPGAWAYADTP